MNKKLKSVLAIILLALPLLVLPRLAHPFHNPEFVPAADSIYVFSVDANRCLGCTECVPVCPTAAISMVNGKAVVDHKRCIGCGLCYTPGFAFAGCPSQAFSFRSQSAGWSVAEVQETTKPDTVKTPVLLPEHTPQPIEHSNAVKEVAAAAKGKPAVAQTPPVKKPATTPVAEKWSKPYYRVLAEKCIGCGACVPNCPRQAITMDKSTGKAVIKKSLCIACGICVRGRGPGFTGCPTKAIERINPSL